MRRDEGDGEHIWLRQSARFTIGGQERTVEIAIPLRPGADPDEVERLLEEADAGMERLSRHLDQRIVALLSSSAEAPATPAPAPAPLAGPTSATPEVALTTAVAPTSAPQRPAPAPSPTPARPPAGAAEATTPSPAAPAATAPTSLRPVPERTTPERTTAPTANRPTPAPAPARPTPAAAATASPAAAAPSAARPTLAPTPSAAPASASASASEELTRPAFLAETRALGLTPPQVMERLGVRTLDGLNLREALELLRRQLVRDTASPPPPPPAAAPASAPAPTRAASVPPTAPDPEPAGTFFDEEDDFDVAFEIPDDEPADHHASFAGGDVDDDFEEEDEAVEPNEADAMTLDEVPDFTTEPAPPPAPAVPTRPARAQSATRAASARTQPSIAERAAPSSTGTMSLAQRAHARDLLARLRAASPGGTPSRAQLTAFANIVTDELGAPAAAALAHGLFGAAPERLGTDQLNVLIQWGKTDDFAQEAPTVLALLRAEREERASGAAATPPSSARSARPTGTRAPGHNTGGSH